MIEKSNCHLDVYKNVKEEVKFLTNSKIRVKILDCLSDLPLTIKNLCKITCLS